MTPTSGRRTSGAVGTARHASASWSDDSRPDRRPADRVHLAWNLPLPPSRGVRGGNEYVFLRPLREGDVVTVHWRLAAVDEHRTRSGGAMVSVVSDIEYVDAGGDVIARNRETVLYQPIVAVDGD